MGAEEEHARIFIKNILRSVAMVIVHIEDSAFCAGAIHPGLSGDGRGVEEAVPAKIIAAGVVSGGPAEREDGALAGSEGLGFSLMVSVRNFALFGTDWLGSLMLDKLHLPFNDLVLANAGTPAIAVPLVFLLPAMLVSRRDAEPDAGEAELLIGYPEPETQPQV